jgi:hypothetical protein
MLGLFMGLGRGAGPGGRPVEVDRQPHLPGDKDEFDAWKTRDLGGIELEYLFLDGSHFLAPTLASWRSMRRAAAPRRSLTAKASATRRRIKVIGRLPTSLSRPPPNMHHREPASARFPPEADAPR